jgi:hypothetical protein
MSDDREYAKIPIICLTCGFDGENPVPAKNGRPTVDKCRCPKCSKTAFVHRPFREGFIINALVKEVIRLRLDVMDLQAYAEGEDRG